MTVHPSPARRRSVGKSNEVPRGNPALSLERCVLGGKLKEIVTCVILWGDKLPIASA